MHLGFRGAQEPGSYLYRARAQYQRRCQSTCISDSTRGDDWNGDRVNYLREEGHQTYHLPLRIVLVKDSAVSPSFHALRNNGIGARVLRGLCLSNRGCVCKPQDSACFQFRYEGRRVESHDRRDGLRSQGQHGVTLRLKVWQHGITRFQWNWRSPHRKERPLPLFQIEVSHRRRLWNPKIDLEFSCAAFAKCRAPSPDVIRLHQQSSARSQPTRIGYGNRQRRRTGSGHGRQQNRKANAQTMGEILRAIAGGWMAFVKHAENLWLDVREASASKTVLDKG